MKISAQNQKASSGSKIDVLGKIGVFSLGLFAAASATYLYSPVIKTNAATSAEVEVTANVSSFAAVTVDTNNLALNYTAPMPEGSFDSGTVTATVTTNSPGGYELYFSSVDNATNMVNTNPAISDVIASDFNDTVTSTTMASNKWGYSTDDTNYSKIPTSSAHATLRNIDHFPSAAEQQNTIRIGAKVDSTLKAGSYSKSVLFSVIAHEPPVPPTMQTFDKTTLANTGDSATLKDERDGNSYVVKKLADGNVWMTQNLKLGKSAAMTLTSADSDVSSDFEIPANDLATFTGVVNSKAVYVNSNGGYYNFYTATVGEGRTSKTSGDVSHSICPKGWRLPTSIEFQTLYTHYNSINALMNDPNFVLSGTVGPDGFGDNDVMGVYWASTVERDNQAYTLTLDNTISQTVTATGYNTKTAGFSVRCVAR